MKIGLYFGSFNPIHNGHLVIAGYMAEFSDLKQVWMVVSPHNPLKPAGTLLQDYHRFHLVELGIGNYKKLKASKIEFELARPSYTVVTLAYLQDKYPKHEFALIMGADNLENLNKWKNFEVIIDRYPIYVYRRPGFEITNTINAKLLIVNAPLLQISATQIRQLIKEGKSIRYMVSDKVMEEIEAGGYYKK